MHCFPFGVLFPPGPTPCREVLGADHPWAGRKVRGVAEQQPAVFDRSGEIVAVVGETVTWVPEGRLTKWQSQIDEIEFTPALQAKRKWKQSKISYSEFTEIKASFQDLDLTVGGKDHTADDSQLQLMCWLIYRDHNLEREQAPSIVGDPTPASPEHHRRGSG